MPLGSSAIRAALSDLVPKRSARRPLPVPSACLPIAVTLSKAQLLQFRFQNYAKISTPAIPGTEWLKPPSRQMLTALAAPCVQDMKICESLITYFKRREFSSHEPLPLQESAVLTTLFSHIHQKAYTENVLVNNLTIKVNEILKTSGERFRLSARKVGAVVSTFGFWKKRTNTGWSVLLERATQVRVHKLVQRHGIDVDIGRFLRADLRECPLCTEGEASQILQFARSMESK